MQLLSGHGIGAATCLVCQNAELHLLFAQRDVPVICNQLLPSPDEARAVTRGDVTLAYCPTCGSIANCSFSPDLIQYNGLYDNALHFSAKFQSFADRLAFRLVAEHNLAGKRVAEIGCGDGYFLRLLLEHGVGLAIGYDPSMDAVRLSAVPQLEALTILPEAFGNQELPNDVEAVFCRHALEHIPDPVTFLSAIRKTIGDRNCLLFLEVPNAQWMLENNSLWDVIYEHVTYWTPTALSRLLAKTGFHPIRVATDFDDQYLMIEARPSSAAELARSSVHQDMEKAAMRFGADAAREIEMWHERLRGLHGAGKTAVLWGAGSKGVTFLNVVPAASPAVKFVVDVNERKQGMYVAGSSHPIVAPDQLAHIAPDLILVANEIYLNEIRALTASMGVQCDFAVISG